MHDYLTLSALVIGAALFYTWLYVRKKHSIILVIILTVAACLTFGITYNSTSSNSLPRTAQHKTIEHALDIEYAFSPNQGATNLIVKSINKARTSIRVAAYSFTSTPIAEALVAAHYRGVDVQVLVDIKQVKNKHSVYAHLLENEVPTKGNSRYSIMHNKFIIIDGDTLQLGSFNYSSSAEKRNAENVLIIRNHPQVIGAYTEQWQKLWDEAD